MIIVGRVIGKVDARGSGDVWPADHGAVAVADDRLLAADGRPAGDLERRDPGLQRRFTWVPLTTIAAFRTLAAAAQRNEATAIFNLPGTSAAVSACDGYRAC